MERSRSIPLPALAAHRRRRGLTQRQLGELADVAHTTVQKLESLKRGAYPQTMQKLATALGVPLKSYSMKGTPKAKGHAAVRACPFKSSIPEHLTESIQREAIYE